MAKLKNIISSKAGFVMGNGSGSTKSVLKKASISRQVNKAFSGKKGGKGGNPRHSKTNGRFI